MIVPCTRRLSEGFPPNRLYNLAEERDLSCELFLRMIRPAAQLTSPEVNTSYIEATQITADARNDHCYAYIHCTYVKCLQSYVEVSFWK
jgi:hypothetical protein